MNTATYGAMTHHGVFGASFLQHSALIQSIGSEISAWLFALSWFICITLAQI